MEIGCREQTVVIFMKEPKQTPTRNLVMECLLGAGSRGMIAREIAACVGGITKGTAGIHARRLENQGLVFSKLESHPGYKHIIRRRYWAKEMST